MNNYCKVVIIDDEFIMRQGMKHMMEWEKQGFQIVGEASNGKEGLEVIEQTKPHIVLSDIVMPIMDGIDFSEILHERFPDVQLIILSSYDKFEYVKSTLLNGASDYILKPTLNPENLLTVLKRTAEKIPGLELRADEKGSYATQMERYLEGYQEKLDEALYADYFPHTLYRLFGINLRKICGNQKDKIAFVQSMVAKYFEQRGEYAYLNVFLGEEKLCCIINYRLKEERVILEDFENCSKKVAAAYPGAFFVVSQSFSDMQEIKKYYQSEVKEQVNQQFYYKGETILSPSTEAVLDEKEKRFPFSEFSAYLNQKNFEDALEMLKGYIDYLCSRKVDEYRVKNLTKNLLYNYLTEIEKYDAECDKFKNIYFRMIDAANYREDFLNVFEEIKQELNAICNDKIESSDTNVIEIQRYIKEHYQEPLDLKELAELFNYNYNYLSSHFSRQAKEGFSEYLNKIRIEKACELLKQGTMTISDVSAQTGYSDHSYFCRVFKKITGETPSNYKRKRNKVK